MKNILRKFRVHPFYLLLSFFSVITGQFRLFSLFTLILIIHELGHLLGALFYHWRIKEVILLPFGGITIFEEHLNKPIWEEFIILILGPTFQILFAFLFPKIYSVPPMFYFYHYALLLFNLLPIYPLDGSKIVLLWFQKIGSFYHSYQWMFIISYLFLCFLFGISFFLEKNLILFFILFFLLIKVILEDKKMPYLFQKFLWERYHYRFHFRKTKNIKGSSLHKMKRDYRHLFLIEGHYVSEYELLCKKFDFKKNIW